MAEADAAPIKSTLVDFFMQCKESNEESSEGGDEEPCIDGIDWGSDGTDSDGAAGREANSGSDEDSD